MQYTVSIPQLDDLQKAFKQAPELVANEVSGAINRSLVGYQATAKQKAPVDSGRLQSSILIDPAKQKGNVIEGSVGTSVDYSVAQEIGTGIYGPSRQPIRPKRAKVLAFPVNGQMVFARQVKGSKGRFYMKGSLDANQDNTERHFQKALDTVTHEIARRSR